MINTRKRVLPEWFDLPMAVAAILTVAFYVVIGQDAFKGSIIHRYTTEHVVEYVVVTFFIWGLVDVVFKACGFPLELMALRQPGLPLHLGREPLAKAADLEADLQQRPQWFLDSRLGRRLTAAIDYLQQKESADGFEDQLRFLAQQDEEHTYTNYALIRFICWVAPVLGILGTVIHFASAFVGMNPDQASDNLGKIMGEIGTAFSTTTAALATAITMMFSLFLCERIEKGIIRSINWRVDRELLSRFEVVDENLTPFLQAVQSGGRATLEAMDGTLERQLKIWSAAFERLEQASHQRLQSHSQLWEQSLVKIHERFQQSDSERDQKLLKLLSELQTQRSEQSTQSQAMLSQIAAVQNHFAQLVEALSGLTRGGGELVKLQQVLTQNLHNIRETQQFDQALHGLTAAIHLLTARHDLDPKAKTSRAA